MKVKILLLAALTAIVAFAVIVFADQKKDESTSATQKNLLYVCNCGEKCKCNTVSVNPGKCKCGQDLVAMHVLKIEKGEAVLCTCGKDCDCKISESDPTKCGCGKDVKRVSLSGLYVCNCGAGCDCNTISDKPGKCRCGNDLKRVD
jgi:hypothetical protein